MRVSTATPPSRDHDAGIAMYRNSNEPAGRLPGVWGNSHGRRYRSLALKDLPTFYSWDPAGSPVAGLECQCPVVRWPHEDEDPQAPPRVPGLRARGGRPRL